MGLASPPGVDALGGVLGQLDGCGRLVMTNARREEFTLEDIVSGRSPSVHWLTRPGIVSVMDSRDNFKWMFIEGEILNLCNFTCLQYRVGLYNFSLKSVMILYSYCFLLLLFFQYDFFYFFS